MTELERAFMALTESGYDWHIAKRGDGDAMAFAVLLLRPDAGRNVFAAYQTGPMLPTAIDAALQQAQCKAVA